MNKYYILFIALLFVGCSIDLSENNRINSFLSIDETASGYNLINTSSGIHQFIPKETKNIGSVSHKMSGQKQSRITNMPLTDYALKILQKYYLKMTDLEKVIDDETQDDLLRWSFYCAFEKYRQAVFNIIDANEQWNLPRGRQISVPVLYNGEKIGEVDYSFNTSGNTINIFFDKSSDDFTLNLPEDTSDPRWMWNVINNPHILIESGDWKINAMYHNDKFLTPYGEIYMHKGFALYFNALKNRIKDQVYNYAFSLGVEHHEIKTGYWHKISPPLNINITGYSQGGVLAHLLHTELKYYTGKEYTTVQDNEETRYTYLFPEITLNTTTFGTPGSVNLPPPLNTLSDYDLSHPKNRSIAEFMKAAEDITQYHYGYDPIPYFFSMSMLPLGEIKYIGPSDKVNRLPVRTPQGLRAFPQGSSMYQLEEQARILMSEGIQSVDHHKYQTLLGGTEFNN